MNLTIWVCKIINFSLRNWENEVCSLCYFSSQYSLFNLFIVIFLQEVNEMWAGLGYYRRARFLLEVSLFFLEVVLD